jgi:hypothetical protein
MFDDLKGVIRAVNRKNRQYHCQMTKTRKDKQYYSQKTRTIKIEQDESHQKRE